MRFSRFEIKEIVKAWLAISLIFGIAITGISRNLLIALPLTFLTAGIGFLFHELAHKYLAQKFRCWAEFRANNQALIIGLLISFTGMVLVAPGGVFIRGANKYQHGKIAFVGPMMNVFLALVFLGLAKLNLHQLLSLTADYGFRINSLLGIFNLIPFPPFDGYSIWSWNKLMYVIGVIADAGVMLLQF